MRKMDYTNNPFLFRTASYSWLGIHRVQRKAGLPAYLSTLLPSSRVTSDMWQELHKYGDEFVQDSHLFPFSPKPAINAALTPSVSYSIRPILPYKSLLFNIYTKEGHKKIARHLNVCRALCLLFKIPVNSIPLSALFVMRAEGKFTIDSFNIK